MKSFKKHHSDDLDGTKGAWRPALIAGVIGVDGHPMSHREVVVFSCPGCGAPQGVGGDDVQILPDGTTDGIVRCYHCPWADTMTFEKHADAAGRSHFNELKAKAIKEIQDTRLNAIREKVREELFADLNDRAMAEAKKIMPDGAQNPQELFREVMSKKKLLP
jgi:hypothetical protein